MTASPLLDKTEASAYLRISRSTLERMVARREIRFHKVGIRVYFRAADLDAFIDAGAIEPLEQHASHAFADRRNGPALRRMS